MYCLRKHNAWATNTVQKSSKTVSSSQDSPHKGLPELLRRHQLQQFSKGIAPHNRLVFAQLQDLVGVAPRQLILDSGCGTGESTRMLSRRFPDHTVLGVDKSAHRLGVRESASEIVQHGNLILVRADLIDFWRLAVAAGWQVADHFLFYPNPWPKPAHLQRRWHGHSVFEHLLGLGGVLELRSNWIIYMQEFAQAVQILTGLEAEIEAIAPVEFISPFERKYAASGHTLFRLIVDLRMGDIK